MEQAIARELTEFAALVQQQGVHAALAYLNRRTPHRYTGLFRFEGEVLRSEVLVDGNQPLVRRGGDVPMAATFCSLVGRQLRWSGNSRQNRVLSFDCHERLGWSSKNGQ